MDGALSAGHISQRRPSHPDEWRFFMTRAKIAWASVLISLSLAGPALASAVPFAMYDNMFYRGKPDATQDGFVVSNILYEGVIWPHNRNYGVLPNRAAFEAMVRAHN